MFPYFFGRSEGPVRVGGGAFTIVRDGEGLAHERIEAQEEFGFLATSHQKNGAVVQTDSIKTDRSEHCLCQDMRYLDKCTQRISILKVCAGDGGCGTECNGLDHPLHKLHPVKRPNALDNPMS